MTNPDEKKKPSEQQAKLPGDIRYRPPTGTESDRLLRRVKLKPGSMNEQRPPKLTSVPTD